MGLTFVKTLHAKKFWGIFFAVFLKLLSLFVEHNASHWEMSCSEWNRNRIEILSDKNLNSDAHEYLIDYLRTKVSDDCDAYIIGRK